MLVELALTEDKLKAEVVARTEQADALTAESLLAQDRHGARYDRYIAQEKAAFNRGKG